MELLPEEMIRALQQDTEEGIRDYRTMEMILARLTAWVEEAYRTNPRCITDKSHLHARMLLSEFYDLRGQYAAAEQFVAPYLPLGDQLQQHDPKRYARLTLQMARIAYRQRNLEKATKLIQESLREYRAQDDWFGEGLSLLYQAQIQYRLYDFPEAKQNALESILVFNRRHKIKPTMYRVSICHLFLARITYKGGKNYQEAQAYLIQAGPILSQTEDFIHQARLEDVQGRILRAGATTQQDYEQAEQHYHAALRLYDKAHHAAGKAMVRNHLGHLYVRMDRFEEAKEVLEFDDARTYEDNSIRVERLYRLAQLYLQWGESERSETKLNKAHDYAQQVVESTSTSNLFLLKASALVILANIYLIGPSNHIYANDEDNKNPLDVAKHIANQIRTLNRNTGTRELISLDTEIAYHLLLAKISCREDLPNKSHATASLIEAEKYLSQSHNEFLTKQAALLGQEIAELDGAFHVAPSYPDLNYIKHDRNLRIWLVYQAMVKSELNKRGKTVNRDQVAARLGVKRQTVDNWMREWGDSDDGNPLLGQMCRRWYGREPKSTEKLPPPNLKSPSRALWDGP